MKNIRAVAAIWCILGAAHCGAAPEGTAVDTTAVALESAAPADSSATAAVQYREAEPALHVATREHPRPIPAPDPPQRGIRVLVDALLLTTAAFTVFSFLGMWRSGHSGYREGKVYRVNARRSRRGAANAPDPDSPSERERLPQNPRERAERLKVRRARIASEIERLMNRV